MLSWILKLFGQLHAQGLGHEAAIEILLGILGLMLALLALMLTIMAIIVGTIGWFGYTSIRDEAVKQAKTAAGQAARKEARRVAVRVADTVFKKYESRSQAAEYTEGYTEGLRGFVPPDAKLSPTQDAASAVDPLLAKAKGKRRATKDQNLREDGRS